MVWAIDMDDYRALCDPNARKKWPLLRAVKRALRNGNRNQNPQNLPAYPEVDFELSFESPPGIDDNQFDNQNSDIFEAIVAEEEEQEVEAEISYPVGGDKNKFKCRKPNEKFAMPHDCSGFITCDANMIAHPQVIN